MKNLTVGYYENFPQSLHVCETFASTVSNKQLQSNIMQILQNLNCQELSFEEISHPTIPKGSVIFEFGIAEDGNFNFIDREELQKTLKLLNKGHFSVLDLFCAIRYYRKKNETKAALKFDYYLLRTVFRKNRLEVQVFHERGPRYISPQDLVDFLQRNINKGKTKNILKKVGLS